MTYATRLLLAIHKLQFPTNEPIHCNVAHDDWCPMRSSGDGGACNCHPDITFMHGGKLYEIDDDGNAKEKIK